MKREIWIEIDCEGYGEVHGYEDRCPWLNYGTLVGYGNTLEQCIESASVSTIDQDGGEGPEIMLDDLAQAMHDELVEQIAAEYVRKTGEQK